LHGKIRSGLAVIPLLHYPRYLEYYEAIRELVYTHHKVLELAAGTGRHKTISAETGAEIYALGISSYFLSVSTRRTQNKVFTVCAPIEQMPFTPNSFDFIVSCGGIFYVANSILISEIRKILKPGGGIIFWIR
jgi:ubiquinone/menaquinone biosynthesis C-methylase UbiE